MTRTMRKVWPLVLAGLVCGSVAFAWRAHGSRYDVDVNGGAVDIDKINLALPMLSQVIKQHPSANRYRVRYVVRPDPQRPREVLSRTVEYNRTAHTLRWSREFWYEHYSHVTDTIIHDVAAKRGGVRLLLRLGCPRTFPRR
jgi:hypothetical protein